MFDFFFFFFWALMDEQHLGMGGAGVWISKTKTG